MNANAQANSSPRFALQSILLAIFTLAAVATARPKADPKIEKARLEQLHKWILSNSEAEHADVILEWFLESFPSDVHLRAATALEACASPKFTRKLMELLLDRDARKSVGFVGSILCYHVAYIEEADVIKLLGQPNEWTQKDAIDLAGRIHISDKTRKRIVARYDSKDRSRRLDVIRFLYNELRTNFREPVTRKIPQKTKLEHIELLKQWLEEDEDKGLRRYIARILVRTGEKSVVPHLIRRMASLSYVDQPSAAGQLRKLTGMNFGVVEIKGEANRWKAVKAWFKWYEETYGEKLEVR
jgi:hypothetical protein